MTKRLCFINNLRSYFYALLATLFFHLITSSSSFAQYYKCLQHSEQNSQVDTNQADLPEPHLNWTIEISLVKDLEKAVLFDTEKITELNHIGHNSQLNFRMFLGSNQNTNDTQIDFFNHQENLEAFYFRFDNNSEMIFKCQLVAKKDLNYLFSN